MSEKLRVRRSSSSATATLAASHARQPSAAPTNRGADRLKFFMESLLAVRSVPRRGQRPGIGQGETTLSVFCIFMMKTTAFMVGTSFVDAVDDLQSRRGVAVCP